MNRGDAQKLRAGYVGVLLLLAAGCQGTAPDAAMPENKFLRTESSALGQITAQEVPALLPLHTGDWWEWAVQRANAAPVLERGSVAGAVNVAGKTGVQVDYRENDKLTRRENYYVGTDGVFFLGGGIAQTVVLSPAMPLISAPMAENAVTSWEGLLQFTQSSAPGRGFSRLSVREPITTPAGKFTCWRVDTTLETNIGGRAVAQLDYRWFTPGIGIVKQETRVGATVTLRSLLAYKVGSKTGGRRVPNEKGI